MTGFGLQPFSLELGPFGGPGLMTIVGIICTGMNSLDVYFDAEPIADDPDGYNSAINPKNWGIEAVDPRITSTTVAGLVYHPDTREPIPTYTPAVGEGTWDRDNPLVVSLRTMAPFEARCRYRLIAQPSLEGVGCRTFAGVDTWPFQAPRRGPLRRARFVQEDRYRDWAFEYVVGSGNELQGRWRIESSGDIGIQGANESLRKRILRRITTRRGAFSHAPTYGLSRGIKRLIRAGELQGLANEVAEQTRLEPDVQAAACEVTVLTDGVVDVRVFARRIDGVETSFVFDFPR